MTNRAPAVSVLMPAYNAEAYIADAIESILEQSFKDFELIIVDDNSSDATNAIIKRYASKDKRVKLVKNEQNLKISASLNKGIAIAKGKYIARMDADDKSLPERLQTQVNFLDQNKQVVLVGSAINVCDSRLKKINVRRYNSGDTLIRQKIFRYGQFCHPAVMFRTAAGVEAGGYDPSLYDAEDYDFFFRLGLHGDMANLNDVLLNYRTSKTSVSASRAKRQELLTLYVRLKATVEYGYEMGFSDRMYSIAQLVSVYIVPRRFKFWLFNFMRRGNG